MVGALDGIRVLDVSTVLAAPVAATLLGDFGAEVVKVEEPRVGDFTRAGVGARQPGGRSLQWLQEGRNKQSVTIDLRQEAGREVLRSLIPHFDVVVTNYRPATLDRWGMDPESLRALSPRTIFVYLTGYGLTGPNRDRGAFDRIASAFSGLTYVTGYPDQEPVRAGYSVIDFMAAYLAAYATVSALFARDRSTGEGQVIDLALYEAGFRSAEESLIAYGWQGTVRERVGNRNAKIVPASEFTARDGRRVALHAGTSSLFSRLTKTMGQADLADNPRFNTREARIENQEELYARIGAWVGESDAADLVQQLNDHDVPASVVMSIADIAGDAHYRQRGTIVEVDDEEFGRLPMVAPLPHMSGTPGTIRHLGPRLGEHTRSVLRTLSGLDDAEITALAAAGVISLPDNDIDTREAQQ